MIYGVGLDIVDVARVGAVLARHGLHFAQRIVVHATESVTARVVAKHFALKEAFSKAMGTGLRYPVSLSLVDVMPSTLGQPQLIFLEPLSKMMVQRCLFAHASLTDSGRWVVAHVTIEVVH